MRPKSTWKGKWKDMLKPRANGTTSPSVMQRDRTTGPSGQDHIKHGADLLCGPLKLQPLRPTPWGRNPRF